MQLNIKSVTVERDFETVGLQPIATAADLGGSPVWQAVCRNSTHWRGGPRGPVDLLSDTKKPSVCWLLRDFCVPGVCPVPRKRGPAIPRL